MGFLGYDPPMPDDLELSPSQIHFIRITHPIVMAICFGGGCTFLSLSHFLRSFYYHVIAHLIPFFFF